MSGSDKSDLVPLDIRASDAATEIYVIDGQLRLAAKGLGTLTERLKPGIYKLKIRAGYAEQEDHVVLQDKPVEKTYPPIRFSSPAPLKDTAEDDPRHIERESRAIQVDKGGGRCIFVFARHWVSGSISQEARRDMHPAKGLTLWDGDRKIADLRRTRSWT
jgi:hypothetical protein